MLSMFDFFQKGLRDGDGRKTTKQPAKASEQKALLLAEARLSSDEAGRSVALAWEKYMTGVLINSGHTGPVCNRSMSKEFEDFAAIFISEYEAVIDDQRNEPLNCHDDTEPACIEDTWGHPTEIVVHMGKQLLEYIRIEGSTGSDKAQEWLAEAHPVDTDKLLLSDSIGVSMRFLFSYDDSTAVEASQRHDSRCHFLYICYILSLLSFWPHNRDVMLEHLGKNYTRLLIQVIRAFVVKLEEVIVGYIERCKSAEWVEYNSAGQDSRLEEDASFILQSLVSLVQVVARGSPQLPRTAERCYSGSLPLQPWDTEAMKRFGFVDVCDYAEACQFREDGELPPYRRRRSTASPGRIRGESTASSTGIRQDAAQQAPLSPDESVDGWSSHLIQCGAVRVLISLLNKLAYLSRALASPHLYQPGVFANSEPEAVCEEDSPRHTKTTRITVLWRGCVALQSEALVALLAYMCSHQRATRTRFCVCNGAGVLSSLLSMQDAPPYDMISSDDFHAGVHRGILCLRLVEQVVFSSCNEADAADMSIRDTLTSLESLQLFMAWLQTYLITQDALNAVELDSHRHRNVRVKVEAVSRIPSPKPESDMWPWTHTPHMNESPTLNMQMKSSFSDTSGSFNVDLCDWGSVMLQYAGADSLAKKYIRSMKNSDDYSLVRAVADVFEGKQAAPSDCSLPWFVNGVAADIWDRLFVILFGICKATQKTDLKLMSKTVADDGWVARMRFLSSILGSILQSLHVCAEAQSQTSMRNSLNVPSGESGTEYSLLPVFQMHMVHFIALCVETFPDETIATCRHHKTWALLASSPSFLLGGQDDISALLLKGKRVTTKNEGAALDGLESTTSMWSLQTDELDYLEPPRLSTVLSSRVSSRSTPGKGLGYTSTKAVDVLEDHGDEDDISTSDHAGSRSASLSEDESNHRLRFDSIDSISRSKDDTESYRDVNENSFFDVEDESDTRPGMTSSILTNNSALDSTINSPLSDTTLMETLYLDGNLSPSPSADDMNAGEATPGLDESFALSPDEEPLHVGTGLEADLEDEWSDITNAIIVKAFAWLSLFDSVFQLMSIVVSSVDVPNQSSLAKAPSVGSTTELYSILQAVGRDTPDHIVLQTINWIKCILIREVKVLNIKTSGNDKYKHILFKCLSLCKYQLLSSCDTTSTPPAGDGGSPPFWIGEEYSDIHMIRPFLWPARTTVIDLVLTIMLISPGKSWCKAFLPKNTPSASHQPAFSSSGAISRESGNQESTSATPKHVTLLLLMLDPKCRDIALYLLMEVLHVCTCMCHNIPIDFRQAGRSYSSSSTSASVALIQGGTGRGGIALKRQSSKADMDGTKTVHHAVFHDIIKCLFVSHIKFAMLQPAWCDGAGVVISTYEWMKSFLCNPDRALYLPYYQNMMLQYGPMGPYHQALNWLKPRPHIFREFFLSVDECMKRSSGDSAISWDSETRITVFRHFLAMLTALMVDSDITKHKFACLMLLKKYSKNKAKVTSSTSTDTILGTNPFSACNFHDVAGMITALEKAPSFETIVILFDMLLDGPCANNRDIMDKGIVPENGLFYTDDSKVCLSNLIVIPIMLLLIPSCVPEVQQCILNSLRNLLVGRFSLVNLSKCGDMQPPILDCLLDLFMKLSDISKPLCVDLMQVIGKHNISVAQLKRLFRLMHTQGDHRPTYSWMLLRCLRLMVNDSKSPKHFFLFEGSGETGLRIPSIHRWPATNGYTFCFWFCVRSPSFMRQDSTSRDMSSIGSLGDMKSIRSDEDSLHYRPTLLSFRQNSGIGLEVFLKLNSPHSSTYTLIFQTHKDASESSQPSRVEISHVMDEDLRQKPIRGGQWYFLAFSHSTGKFRSRSELGVLINNFYSKHQLSYPKFLGEIEEPVIGDCTPALASVSSATSLRGQMGSIYVFSEALPEMQMRKLYAIGMDISREFDNSQITRRGSQGQLSDGGHAANLNLDALSSVIMLAYNPGVWDGNYFLDMTPEKNAVRWGKESRQSTGRVGSGPKQHSSDFNRSGHLQRLPNSRMGGKMHAYMLPGTYRCTFRDMRDALDCLGGKRVLIPLFAQFDLPALNDDMTPNYDIDTKLSVEVVELFFSLTRDSDESRQFMMQSGFQLVAYFLERISPQYLTLELLNVFIENSEKLLWRKDWYGDVVKYILLNFKLWMFATYDTQLHLFNHLLQLCQKKPDMIREIISVRELFDALYVIYSHGLPPSSFKEPSGDSDDPTLTTENETTLACSDDEEFEERHSTSTRFAPSRRTNYIKRQGSIYSTQSYVHEATGEVVAEKLAGDQLDDIRHLIFRMIYALIVCRFSEMSYNRLEAISGTPVEEEVQCIMYYASHESTPRAKVQALQLLIRLLATPSVQLHKKLLSGFSTGVKIYPLLALHLNPNPRVRMYAFLALCNVIQIATAHGDLPEFGVLDKKKKKPMLRSHTLSPKSSTSSLSVSFHGKGSEATVKESVFFPEETADTLSDISESSLDSDIESGVDSLDNRESSRPKSRSVASRNYTTPSSTSSPKNSFSFVAPMSNPVTPKFSIGKSGRGSTKADVTVDSFAAIGIPVSNLRYVLLWAQDNLLRMIEMDILNSHLVDQQCKVIVSIMTHTMVGLPSTDIVSEIDDLFVNLDDSFPDSGRSSDHSNSTNIGSCPMSEHLSESIFCVAAFVPATLRFISRDIVPYALRFSTLVGIKTKLQSFSNCDLLLQVPMWQTSLFEFLTSEQRRIQVLQCKIRSSSSEGGSYSSGSAVKELDRSTGILDTGIRMICELFLHTIEFGCPVPEVVISRPTNENTYTPPKPNPITMLQDIAKGKRIFGPKVLQETMSMLRCYAEMGELDVEVFGISLLQQIVNALILRQDSWKNMDSKELELHHHIRMRTFNICCWLTASFILEFVTAPVVADVTLKKSIGDSSSSPALQRTPSGEVTPLRRSESYSKNDSTPVRRKSTPEVPPPSLSRIHSEPMSVRSSHDPPSEMTDIASPYSTMISVAGGYSSPAMKKNTSDLSVITDSNDECSGGNPRKSPTRISVSGVFEGDGAPMTSPPPRPLSQKTISRRNSSPPGMVRHVDSSGVQNNECGESMWYLLDSIITLLETLDPDFHRKGKVSMKIALSVGIKASQGLLDIMNDTIEDVVPHTSPAGEPETVLEHSITGRAIPAWKISSQICWRLVRVLCNIFSQTGSSRTTLSPAKQSSQLQALKRLRRTINTLEVKDWGAHRFEILHAAVKIADVLRHTAHRPSESWVQDSIQLLVELVEKSKESVFKRLENLGLYYDVSEEGADDTFVDSRMSLSLPSPRPSALSSASTDDTIDEKNEKERPSFDDDILHTPGTRAIGARILDSSSEGRRSTSETTIMAINIALRIPSDSTFTWQVWDSAMSGVLQEAIRMEDEALTSTLTELGLHKNTRHAAQQLDMMRSEEVNNFAILSRKSQTFSRKANEHETNAMQRLVRSSESLRKRNASRWNMILEELANERGPWGVGAEESVEVYWMMDFSEDYQRKRYKLRRNPYGSSHQMATYFSKGRSGGDSDCEDDFSAVSTASDLTDDKMTVASSTVTVGPSSKTVSQGLWKDLIKYQTRAIQRSGEGDPNDPDGDDGELSPEEQVLVDETDTVEKSGTQSSPLRGQDTKVITAEVSEGANADTGKVLFSHECEIITPSTNSMCPPAYGMLEVTSTRITFTKHGPGPRRKPAVLNVSSGRMENYEFLWATETFPSSQWSTEEICNVLSRTFYLRPTAVEVFLTSRKAVFINLHSRATALQFIFVIRNVVKPPHIAPFFGHKPQHIIQEMTLPGSTTLLTRAWETREISNFEYLMQLNTIAGRSYNDLGQYPVFPWVIADYVSHELKLREPSTYRDLRWPMGAQRAKQREEIMHKYEDINLMYQMSLNGDVDMGPALPPFHFGSHYSTAGFVLWYLMRVEPFTSLHVQLQEGKFDKTDRLFDSISAAWTGCTNNPTDVKELVPEFFFLPEIFENVNKLDLGRKTSSRKTVSDIVLPPWASDPFEFVRLNRKALESEYVSKNLHHWIDLVFGYKQRPPYMRTGGNDATVSACNVFFHLTYADAVDLDELLEKDKSLYDQYVNQIAEFGQTPAQLFSRPHPQRYPIDAADIAWPIASVVPGADTIMKGGVLPDKPRKILCFRSYKISVWPVVFIAETAERLITVDTSRIIGNHMWQSLAPDVVPPYKMKIDVAALELSHGLASGTGAFSMMSSYSSNSSVRDKRVGVPFFNQILVSQPALTSQEAGEDAAKAEPVPKKEFVRLERDIKRMTAKRLSTPAAVKPISSPSRSDQSSTAGDTEVFKEVLPEPPISSVGSVGMTRKSMPSSNASTSATTGNRVRTISYNSRRRGRTRTTDEHLSSQLFAVHHGSKMLFSCGHWDHTFKVTAIDTGRLIQSVSSHKDAVTCLTLASDFGRTWLVTGSRDCTLMIWDVHTSRDMPLGPSPAHVLYGHDDAVTSVSVSTELDVVVSGSEDGTVIVHSLREGSYTRSILVGASSPMRAVQSQQECGFTSERQANGSSASRRRIHWVCVTRESYVVVYLIDEHLLCTYTINGRLIATKDIRERLYAFAPSEDGQVLITGGENCLVVFRWVHTLELANDGPRKGLEAVLDGMIEDSEGDRMILNSPIRSLYLTKNERHLIVGSEAGEIRVFAQDSEYLRQRLQRKLEEIGIL